MIRLSNDHPPITEGPLVQWWVCHSCRERLKDHAAGGKCLFMPGVFQAHISTSKVDYDRNLAAIAAYVEQYLPANKDPK